MFLSVVDGVDNARGRRTAHGERTKAEDDGEASGGKNMSRGRCVGPVAGEGSTRVDWFGCRCMMGLSPRRITGRVGE